MQILRHTLPPLLPTIPYRWLWASQCLSVAGIIMTRLALGWFTLTLTDSALWVGGAAVFDGAGKLGAGLFAGALIDSLGAKRAALISQLVLSLSAITIGMLIVSNQVVLWEVLAASIVIGGTDALLAAATSTMTVEIVGHTQIIKAGSLQALGFNLARTVGAAMAGNIIYNWGIGYCYLTAGVSALLGVAMLALVEGDFYPTDTRNSLTNLVIEGYRYIHKIPALRQVILASTIVEFFAFSHYLIMPVLARDVLGTNSTGLGYITAAGGVGAIVGAVTTSGFKTTKQIGALLWAVALGAAAILVVFALSKWYLLSLVLAAVLGSLLSAYDVIMWSLVQLLSPSTIRGRISSVYTMTFGAASLGGYLAGMIAGYAGAQVAIASGGIVIIIFLITLAKPLYRIQPETVGLEKISIPNSVVSRSTEIE